MLRRSLAMALVLFGHASAQVLERSLDLEFLSAPIQRFDPGAAALPLHTAFVAAPMDAGGLRTREAVRVIEIQELGDLCPFLLPSAMGKKSLTVLAQRHSLRVRGTEEEQAALERGLRQFVQASERSALVSIEREAPDGSRHFVGRAALCHGVPARLGALISERHCIGVEVEVAQDSAIASPRMARLNLGESFLVTALRWPDDRWLLRIAGGHSEVQDIETRRLSGEQLGRIELPHIQSDLVIISAVLAAGESFEFALQSGDALRSYRVQLEAEPAEEAPAQAPFIWLPLGPAVMAPENSVTLPEEKGQRELPITKIPWHLPYEPADAAELLRSGEPERWSRPDHHLQVAGRGLFVRGDEAVLEKVRARWIQALEPFAGTYAVDFRLMEREVRVDPSTSLDTAPIRATLSSALGEPFYASLGVERLILRESAVEIAQESQILAPEFRPSFAGLVLSGRLSRGLLGSLRLAIRGSRSDLLALGRTVQVTSDVDLERRSDWSFELNRDMALDSWVALAEGPSSEGGSKRRVLWARVSAAAR